MRQTGWGIIAIAVVVISVLALSALHPSGAPAGGGASRQASVYRTTGLLAPPLPPRPDTKIKPLGAVVHKTCKSCGGCK